MHQYGIILLPITGGLVDAIGDRTCVIRTINGFSSIIMIVIALLQYVKLSKCGKQTVVCKIYENAMDADWSWKSSVRQYGHYIKAEQFAPSMKKNEKAIFTRFYLLQHYCQQTFIRRFARWVLIWVNLLLKLEMK